MQPTIPQDLAFILPFFAAGLTHYLASDRLAPWKNALMAAISLLATALLCAWLSGTFLLDSPQASVLAILAYVVLLMNGAFKTILAFLEGVPSPFDPPPPANPNPVRVPTALAMPPNVPPRASAGQEKPPGA